MNSCTSCTHIWLDPRPTIADIPKVYRAYYTHGLTATGSTFKNHVRNIRLFNQLIPVMSQCVRKVQDSVLAVRFGYCELRKGWLSNLIAWTLGFLPGMTQGASMQVLGLHAADRGRVLDIGCGNGAILARLRSLGWDAVGYEMDPVAARFARESFGLDVREGELAKAGFVHESFDVVILSHVIEHVHSPVDFVRQIKNLLNSNGKLIILTPNTNGLGHKYFKECWRGLEPPRHINCFNAETLSACVEQGSMRIIKINTLSRMTRAIWYSSIQIKKASMNKPMINNIMDYIKSYLMQFIESILCLTRKNAGEEILLIAAK
jgi:2-polyprenyl-3-methyl-5-hydroxy-6-metoxy-1,4-benzoquinol methylase